MGFECRLIEGEHERVAIGGGRNMIRFGLERNSLEYSNEKLDKFYPELLKHYENPDYLEIGCNENKLFDSVYIDNKIGVLMASLSASFAIDQLGKKSFFNDNIVFFRHNSCIFF